jgi:hypothetical protein
VARKFLQLGSILLGTLLALELALQLAGALGTGRRGTPFSVDAAAADFVVLCVGDSHTFGAGVTTRESYPARVERMLRERRPNVRFQVLNYGVPGVNTAYVANRLERWILELRPDLVIVWAGINNWWNASETDAWGQTGFGLALRRFLLHSKLVRVAAVVWQTRTGTPGARSRGPEMWYLGADLAEKDKAPGHQIAGPEIARGTAFDFQRMMTTARALDTPILMIDYPYQKTSASVGAILRAVADPVGVPVLSTLEARDRAHAKGHEAGELIFKGAGVHPTGTLYGYIAEAMLPLVLEVVDRRHASGSGTDIPTGGN